MLIGELILSGETVYTPPVPRGGSKAVFAIDPVMLFPTSPIPTLTVTVQHKNFDQPDDTNWTSIAGASITNTTVTAITAAQLKEQVRLKLVVSSSASDRARVFIYEPTWED